MSKAAELAKMGEVLTNSQIGGRRNIIINGAMKISQRATSVTGLGDDNDENYPTIDRFEMNGNAGAGRLTMSQASVTDLPGFPECLKLDCTTADTSIAAAERLFIQTKIEAQDLQGTGTGTADAKPITLSFYAKASASFKFVAALLNVDNDRYAGSTFDVTTSWQRFIITFPADVDDGSSPHANDNTRGLDVRFFLHAGSNYTSGTLSSTFANADATNTYDSNAGSFYSSTDNNFFLTGVQLEVGSQATPFEHRTQDEEMKMCQRYYYRTPYYQNSGHAANETFPCVGNMDGAATGAYLLCFPNAMRAAPSAFEQSGTPSHYSIRVTGDSNGTTGPSAGGFTSEKALINLISSGAGQTSGAGAFLRMENTSAFLAFDAEL